MKIYHQALALLLVVSSVSARLGQDNDNDAIEARYLKASKKNKKIKDQYIVKIAKGPKPKGLLHALLKGNPHAELLHEYHSTFLGFAVKGIPEAAMRNLIRKNPDVILSVEEDIEISTSVTWGLDRIDQEELPLDNSYATPSNLDGSGVDVYIIDTGVQTTHNEFNGRISTGVDFTGEGAGQDGNGHGTHVAGTAAGSTYGVAKGANIIPVRVLDSSGSGSGADVIAGIEWVKQQHESTPGKKSVANLSLGGEKYQAENDAVAAAVAAGVVMVVAAGNESTDACTKSPASEPTAITVASSTSSDGKSGFSNTGTCVDMFAPGSSITSAWIGGNSATNTISGTSMAAPHVAGAAALLLQADATKAGTAAEQTLKSIALSNKISNPGAGTPNLLLHINGIVSAPAPAPPSPTPAPPTGPSPSPSANVEVFVDYDNYPEETTFFLEKADGSGWTKVLDVGVPSSGADYQSVESLTDGDYRFTIRDSYGDGICCSYGVGSYKLTDLGANWAFYTGGEFGNSERKHFSVVNGAVVLPQAPAPAPVATTVAPPPATTTTTSTTTVPVTTTTTSTTTVPVTTTTTTTTTTPPPPAPSPTVAVDMKVRYDYYFEETSFKLHKKTGPSSWALVHSQPAPIFEPSHPVTVSVDLEPGQYRFTIRDSYGDGNCCAYGDGYYRLKANGSVFASGGDFGHVERVFFTI